jgi:lipoprotein-anchoring transpeptidase ErfK/SrfK
MALKLVTALALTAGLTAVALPAAAQFGAPLPPAGAALPADDDGDVLSPAEQRATMIPNQPPMSDPRAGSPVELNAPLPGQQAERAMPPQGAPLEGAAPQGSTFQGPASARAYPDSYQPAALRPPGEIDSAAPGQAMPPAPGQIVPGQAIPGTAPDARPAPGGGYASLGPDYEPETGQPKELPPNLRRQTVEYFTKEPVGTIIIDTPNTYLYLVIGKNLAMRYGIGVGREGFTWSGKEKISRMAEWPDWHPPAEMIERQPYLPRFMAGGESNPLGARALYIGSTLYRIHGTNQPSTIGTFVSSGCIRLTNADIEDLYTRVKVGTKIIVLPGNPPAATAATGTAPNGATAQAAPAPQAR